MALKLAHLFFIRDLYFFILIFENSGLLTELPFSYLQLTNHWHNFHEPEGSWVLIQESALKICNYSQNEMYTMPNLTKIFRISLHFYEVTCLWVGETH